MTILGWMDETPELYRNIYIEKWNSLTLQVLKGFLQESQTVNKVKISL